MAGKIKVGVVGCGCISEIYMHNLTKTFKNVEVVACMDLIRERAEQRANQFNVPKVHDLEDFYKDPEIELVVNLTIPKSHYDVDTRSLNAGKHVYSEKPFALNKADGKKIVELAKSKNLLVGCAPETFLGGGIQTCRKLIDEGVIGFPVAATAFMMGHGPENWHPAPEFFYKAGGGPMFDMGPYYITALVSLLGPVARVCGSAQKGIKTRTITSNPLYGKEIEVEVPTHIAGVLDFASGAVGTIITSFEVYSHTLPCIEIYGTEGTLRVPDPNTFGGPVYVKRFFDSEWSQIPLLKNYSDNSRGIGITDMAEAIEQNRPHRASGELAFHALDVMYGIHEASASGKYCKIAKGKLKRPAAM